MEKAKVRRAQQRRKPKLDRDAAEKKTRTLSMRQLGKLTAEEVAHFEEPIAVTNNGQPVAWLVPMSEAERLRAQLIATGRFRPAARKGLEGWQPLPPREDGILLSDALVEMRQQEGR